MVTSVVVAASVVVVVVEASVVVDVVASVVVVVASEVASASGEGETGWSARQFPPTTGNAAQHPSRSANR